VVTTVASDPCYKKAGHAPALAEVGLRPSFATEAKGDQVLRPRTFGANCTLPQRHAPKKGLPAA